MKQSVESYCNLLVRSRLVAADDARGLYERWQREAGDQAGYVGRFAVWLVAGGHLTAYQASRLARGRAEGYFLDQYRILDKITRGPQAGLYRAVHQLGQVVAIKVLSHSKARDAGRAARFLNEARLALRLKHPHVIRTFQAGKAGGGYFLVMEHIEGYTLEDVLRQRGRLPPAEAVRLIHQALLGLQHLHEQGIIHRDLKPANLVLVSPSPLPLSPAAGERGRGEGGLADTTAQAAVKIVDIDLGRGLPEHVADGQARLGTPDYLAPEQALDARAVDIRADIYSLGCVLYHCLAAQPPFPDANVINQMLRHASEPPRPLRELNPAVPDGLQQMVNWMLAKDPAQRYPTPERAAQALQVFLAAGAEPAGGAGTDPQLRSYLEWLETSEQARQPTEPGLSSAAPAEPHGKHKKQRTDVKPEAPAAAVAPVTFDVELVPFEQLARPRAGGLAELDRRDLLMLGAGAGGSLFAVFLGWLLARVLRRTPEGTGEPE